jgi:hypothetical protein
MSKKTIKILERTVLTIFVGSLLSLFLLKSPKHVVPYYFIIYSIGMAILPLGRLNEKATKKNIRRYVLVNSLSLLITLYLIILSELKSDNSPVIMVIALMPLQAGLNGLITKSVFWGRSDTSILNDSPLAVPLNIMLIVFAVALLGYLIYTSIA